MGHWRARGLLPREQADAARLRGRKGGRDGGEGGGGGGGGGFASGDSSSEAQPGDDDGDFGAFVMVATTAGTSTDLNRALEREAMGPSLRGGATSALLSTGGAGAGCRAGADAALLGNGSAVALYNTALTPPPPSNLPPSRRRRPRSRGRRHVAGGDHISAGARALPTSLPSSSLPSSSLEAEAKKAAPRPSRTIKGWRVRDAHVASQAPSREGASAAISHAPPGATPPPRPLYDQELAR